MIQVTGFYFVSFFSYLGMIHPFEYHLMKLSLEWLLRARVMICCYIDWMFVDSKVFNLLRHWSLTSFTKIACACCYCFVAECEDDDDSYYSDEDDEGWITPGNIEAVKQAASAMNHLELSSLSVACITTDYAMQVVDGD